jgi:Protein of unknown function (DUF3618)
MGEDPGQIRQDIEQQREELGETVSALAYKADVPTRVKDSVADKRDRLKAQMSSAGSSIGDATPDGGDIRDGAKQAVGVAQENPLGLAIGGVAVGFLVGMVVPSTRIENEKIGPIADDVKDKVRETGQEAVERGKDVAQNTAQAAAEAAQESGREQAEALRSSAEDKVSEVGEDDDQSSETSGQSASGGSGSGGPAAGDPGTKSTPPSSGL